MTIIDDEEDKEDEKLEIAEKVDVVFSDTIIPDSESQFVAI